MARRRKQIEFTETGEPVQVTPEVVEESSERTTRKRIVIPIRESGLDVSRLSDADKQAIAQAVAQAGLSQAVDPVIAAMIIDAAANLEAAILASKTGLPKEVVGQAVCPTEPLRGMIAESLAKVASKHNLMGRWGDEIALAALLVSWQAAAIAGVRSLEAERKTAQASQTSQPETAAEHPGNPGWPESH